MIEYYLNKHSIYLGINAVAQYAPVIMYYSISDGPFVYLVEQGKQTK